MTGFTSTELHAALAEVWRSLKNWGVWPDLAACAVQLRRGQHEAAAAANLDSDSQDSAQQAHNKRLARELEELRRGAWSFETAECVPDQQAHHACRAILLQLARCGCMLE